MSLDVQDIKMRLQYNVKNWTINPINGIESLCSCCGSSWNISDPDHYLFNSGLDFLIEKTPSAETTEEYWVESVPLDEGWFLNIRHRKDIEVDHTTDDEEESW